MFNIIKIIVTVISPSNEDNLKFKRRLVIIDNKI
jgi:hypothetical protein